MLNKYKNFMLNKFTEFSCAAIVDKDTTYSYYELDAKIITLQSYLKINKIGNGQVVAIISDYSFISIALFFALLEEKAIIVPITSTIYEEINLKLKESFADTVIKVIDQNLELQCITHDVKHPLLNDLQDKQHAGLILFSSGSTGKPKAMVHDLDNIVETYRDKNSKRLTMLVFLMFDHIGGINTLLRALVMGATIVIPENRSADHICGLVEKQRINVLPSSPTFLNLILISEAYKRHNLSSLRMISYGTEAMPESLLERLRLAFPKVKFLQTFGTSETGIAQTSSKTSTSTLMKIDDENVEYKIVNSELWLRSKTQILGYLNASMDDFTNDGWFKTGDLVEVSVEGYLRIVGRIKEVINVGGEKVLPSEVEAVLLEMYEIDDCLVYARQNAITGQTVIADVVLNESSVAQDIKKIVRKFCKEKLAGYKIPTKVNIVESILCSDRFKKIRTRSS